MTKRVKKRSINEMRAQYERIREKAVDKRVRDEIKKRVMSGNYDVDPQKVRRQLNFDRNKIDALPGVARAKAALGRYSDNIAKTEGFKSLGHAYRTYDHTFYAPEGDPLGYTDQKYYDLLGKKVGRSTYMRGGSRLRGTRTRSATLAQGNING